MKTILLILAISFGCLLVASQTPNSFSYQAVLRDASGNIRANANATIGLAILKESASGNSVFFESHIVTTNSSGLVNLEIRLKNPAGFYILYNQLDEKQSFNG